MRSQVRGNEPTITKEIVIKKQHNLASRSGYSGIQCYRLALVLLLDRNKFALRPEGVQHFTGSVGGTIHNNNDFVFATWQVLIEKSREAARKSLPAIVACNDYGDLHPADPSSVLRHRVIA